MILTFAEDFTGDIGLDSELTAIPSSGLYFNRGVHPVVTVKNLLSFLPIYTFTPAAYVAGTTYGKYDTTQVRTDLVTYNSVIYESIVTANLGNTPSTSPTKWRATNLESLRVKNFIKMSRSNMISALNLTRKLVENQYIYNVGDNIVILPGDYSGWVIEPKGSDYIKIRINEIALQANTTDEVSLYVVNQGILLDTLTLTPSNGVLEFENVPYEISAKGPVVLAFASQSVKTQVCYNDALRYNGFVAYPVHGTGASAALSTWLIGSYGNGLNFNISAYLDSEIFITNNEIDFAKMQQAQFEMDFLRLMSVNGNIRGNRNERGLEDDRLYYEITDLKNNTVARRYNSILNETREIISRTFDRALTPPDEFGIEIGTI